MSTLQEIEAAIGSLTSDERAQLIQDLPRLLPELSADAQWERIIHDARPRPAFSALIDQIESQHRQDAQAFPETHRDFDRQFPV